MFHFQTHTPTRSFVTICAALVAAWSQGAHALNPIVKIPHPVALSSATDTTCALISDGSVYCWGDNRFAQAGQAGQTFVPRPQPVTLAAAATAVAVGETHACALLTSGDVQCWGINVDGQLGVSANFGTATLQATPAIVQGLNGPVLAIAAGMSHTCALVQAGSATQMQCWGYNFNWQLGDNLVTSTYHPQTVPGSNRAIAVTAGHTLSCALLPTSVGSVNVRCWGQNSSGQLGRNFFSTQELPGQAVILPAAASTVHSGAFADSACAQIVDGTLRCWGSSQLGQLGDGSYLDSALPSSVWGSPVVSAYAMNDRNTCAVIAGVVQCWGDNMFGQFGNGSVGGTSAAPVVSAIHSGASAVAVGEAHACALVNWSVECWGDNSYGQLGNNSFTAAPSPVLTILP